MVVFVTCVVCITEFWINLFAAAGPKACSRFGRNFYAFVIPGDLYAYIYLSSSNPYNPEALTRNGTGYIEIKCVRRLSFSLDCIYFKTPESTEKSDSVSAGTKFSVVCNALTPKDSRRKEDTTG